MIVRTFECNVLLKMVCYQVMKSAMNTCMNEINSDSSEQKYVHLSNCLTASFEIRYTFIVWIHSGRCGFVLWECHTCPLFGGGLQLHFTIFLVSLRMCRNFKIWIHSVVRLDKRDKTYKAQAHCLTYALTGLLKMFHPQQWPFHLMVP